MTLSLTAPQASKARRWWRPTPAKRPADVSPEFHQAFVHGIMETERLRMKTLIVTSVIIVLVMTIVALLFPQMMDRIWNSEFQLRYAYMVFVPFIIVESLALVIISYEMKRVHDLPVFRRYFNAFVETSMPTFGLAIQMTHMGDERALAFVIPLFYFFFIILSTLRLDFWLSAFTGLVAGGELFLMAMFFPAMHASIYDPWNELGFHVIRSIVLVGGGLLAGAVGAQLRRQFVGSIAAATARDRVTNLFGQHVSPQVVEQLLSADTSTATDAHEVAVMFVDIRSFTAAARQRPPEEVVRRLDTAFEVLVEIIDRNGGIVNKFLGDGFLALFGAPLEDPDAGQRAVTAGREILQATERANAASDWPLRLGIGIHIGKVVAGSVGSSRRKEYTVIGDTVNFAARLEALNKDYGSQLLISDDVFAAVRERRDDAVSLGEVAVRGYDRPQVVWRLA
jgi:adenylate cyclase